ncbi:MAG TPA: ABC transporter substrate-binding protein [Chloroflexia bacterium]|nr:ABC transporter substrate-binding protein [Chloroflexia bacterium]
MSQSLRKMISLATVAMILTVLLAACGGGATPVPATPTTGGGAATEPTATTGAAAAEATPTTGAAAAEATATTGGTAGGPLELPSQCSAVEINYWNPFTGPDGPFMQQIVDNFNTDHPNIKVNNNTNQAIGGQYDTQLDTAQASGQLPNVAIINEDAIATRAFRNTLRPIDDFVDQVGIQGSDFPEVAWNTGEVAGKRYGIPLSFVVMTMFYNEDLMNEAGITSVPTNREEFEAAAEAMTKDGKNGYLLTTAFPVQQIFQQLLHQFGGQEFSDDGTEATWNSDAGVQALTWMKETNDKFGQANLEVDAELNAFKAGNVGMIWNGIWQIPNVTGEAVAFAGKAAPPPQIGDEPATWAGGPFLTMPVQPSEDECKDTASIIFIKYVLDNSLEWAKAGNVPAMNTVRNSAEFQALPHAVLAPAVENPVFPPSIPGIGSAFAPLGEAVSAVIAGTQTDIKAALDDAAQRANAILEENRQEFGDAPAGP